MDYLVTLSQRLTRYFQASNGNVLPSSILRFCYYLSLSRIQFLISCGAYQSAGKICTASHTKLCFFVLVIYQNHRAVYHLSKQTVIIVDVECILLTISQMYDVSYCFSFRKRIKLTYFKVVSRLHTALSDGFDFLSHVMVLDLV